VIDRKVQLACLWGGPLFAVLYMLGCVPLAGFIPPPSPAASAASIASLYRDNVDEIRVGCVLMMIGAAFIAPWGASIAAQTRRMETGVPILTYVQLACTAFALINVVLIALLWAVAAFRPDDVAPDTTRMLNDFGWFVFLFAWPVFSVWCLAIAVAIFRDRSARPVFPRWVAYVNVWAAVLYAPSALMLFFKTGPFTYRGLITFYETTAVTFAWMLVMTISVIRAIKAMPESQTITSEAIVASRQLATIATLDSDPVRPPS
jgi:hypothetical protein